MAASHVYIGTAGWSIAGRHAALFPGEGTHLERYARRLNVTEINSSFYRAHRRETYERWAGSVPDGFRFSVKLPKAITHEMRLAGSEALLEAFIDQVSGLGSKLGVVLVQLPPSLDFDEELAPVFLRRLCGSVDAAVVCEARHASWFVPEVDELLADLRIARVRADPLHVAEVEAPGGWKGLAYLRLHGAPRIYYSDYSLKRLAEIGDEVRALGHDRETWCIFDNTAQGHALANAVALAGIA